MRIDLTAVLPLGFKSIDELVYECELEINDIKHILQFKDDIMNMRKLVRKFLLNQICISKLIGMLLYYSNLPP